MPLKCQFKIQLLCLPTNKKVKNAVFNDIIVQYYPQLLTFVFQNVPNVDARFGATKSGGGGGLYSVFTSSQSETANVNGKPVSRQQASTTVNDNGKVSTYTVHNP